MNDKLDYFIYFPDFEDKRLTLEAIAMYSLGLLTIFFPFALSTLPFIFKDTPANIILRFSLPASIMKDKTTEKILSSLYWLIQGILAAFPIVQLISIVILVLFESRLMLSPFYQSDKPSAGISDGIESAVQSILRAKRKLKRRKKVDKTQTRFGTDNAWSKVKSPIRKVCRFPTAYKRYQVVSIIFKSFQSFGNVLFPGLMFIAFLLCVVCTYVVVRLSGTLPEMVVGSMAVADFILIFNTFTVYSFAIVITNETEAFIEYWKDKLGRLMFKKQLRVCQPIRIYVSNFFPLYKLTVLLHIQQVVDKTVTILLI